MRENRIGEGEVVGGLLSPEIKVSALKNCARLFKGEAVSAVSSHVAIVLEHGNETLSLTQVMISKFAREIQHYCHLFLRLGNTIEYQILLRSALMTYAQL